MRTPLLLLKIIAKAALHLSGVGGIWSMLVEDGPELADRVMEEWENLRNPAERRDDYEALAVADDLDVEAVLAEVARDEPEPVRLGLTAYLKGVPGSVSRSLRRLDDPEGRSVPPTLVPRSAVELVPVLTPTVVQFKVGDRPLPGVPWELVEHLGTGGFGEVWKARHMYLDEIEPVALKFCTDPMAREQLLKHEAKLCARVMRQGRHDGIVALRQAYLDVETPCLEYEYVPGGTLANLIREWHGDDPSGVADNALRSIRDLAEIVAFAHRIKPEPIVHRDLKPANILVRRTDRGLQLKIGDFGIGGIACDRAVRENRAGSRPGLLLSRSVGGSHTPLYASPEQIRGGTPDPRDDVHALGVIWYQMLTGDLSHGAPGGGRGWRRRMGSLGLTDPLIDVLESCFESVEDRAADAGSLLNALIHVVEPKSPRPAAIATPRPESAKPIATPAPAPEPPAPRPAESAKGIVSPASGIKLNLIPAGTFEMGSNDGKRDERPVHSVAISKPFYLGIYPVTQEEWAKLVNADAEIRKFVKAEPSHFNGRPMHPVENVSWFDAIHYCNALSRVEGRTPCYRITEKTVEVLEGDGYRLPTEAEWEYACRAGSKGRYCFGDDEKQLGDYAWYDVNSGGQTHPVGEKKANGFGLKDMHGNVWEWCWDGLGAYAAAPALDPRGPYSGLHRMFRGGGWLNVAALCRTAYRSSDVPTGRSLDYGFRLALSSVR